MSRIYIEEKPKRVLPLNKGACSEILFRIDKKGYNTALAEKILQYFILSIFMPSFISQMICIITLHTKRQTKIESELHSTNNCKKFHLPVLSGVNVHSARLALPVEHENLGVSLHFG